MINATMSKLQHESARLWVFCLAAAGQQLKLAPSAANKPKLTAR